jgi:acetylornithine deacetylase/succinyl-diaminopimelate desuccinylase-like protein
MLRRALIRKHRKLARACLYLTPLVIVGIGWGVVKTSRFVVRRGWLEVDYTQYESVRLLQEYVRIDTSYPEGNEIPGAELLARELAAMGLEPHLERIGDRHANLWAILEGEDPQALVLHNHIDTDPVPHPEHWRHPPFSGAIELPFIYGRGAFDMKSIAIAQLMAVKALRQAGQPPKRSVIFLATGDEERDSRLGTRWVLRHHPELVARFWAMLTEGGGVEAVTPSEVKYWGTEFAQKRFVELRVCNAERQPLEALHEDINSHDYPQGRRQLSPPIRRFLKIYGPSRAHTDFRLLLRDPDSLPEAWNFGVLPRKIQAMVRNELTAFPVEEDPEGGYTMRVVLHLLSGTEPAEAMEELLLDGLSGFSYTVDVPHQEVPASPLDHPVFQGIHEHLAEVYPGVTHGPLFLPWVATDARFFRTAGIPAYGFSPFVIVAADSTRIGLANERIAAPAFVVGVDLYVGLVRRLTG